ncbi:MAG: peptide chain release factor-like protein [Kiritimatiellae bacterium]|nr:peptide chain release factor-like protein [Kiritimatiellia bacterium]
MADAIAISAETLEKIRAKMELAGLIEDDIEESFVRGAGSGGQKINKTSSCVRLLHKPTGEMVKCQETRSREANRWLARRALAERLLERAQSAESERIQAAEKIRRQKRRRSRRQRAKMLADKRRHSEKKNARAKVNLDE